MSEIKPLWPNNHIIPVIGVTGGFGTGKTKFLLSIARPDRTRIYDTEMSSVDCDEFVTRGLDRVDVAKEIFNQYPQGYTQKQYFVWWLKSMRSIEPGRFDAILVDIANELESGLMDWVASRHTQFGYKTEAGFRSMKGVFQGIVKDEWKRVKIDLAQRCQTFGFANHMRGVWIDGEPTGNKEAKGKDSFFSLSGLYLELFQEADDACPRGRVLKSRLDHTVFNEDGLVERIVPIIRKDQILPRATPQAIRDYIKSPVGTRKLRPDEKAQEPALSDDEKLQLKARIASAEAKRADLDSDNIAAAAYLEEKKLEAMNKQEKSKAAALASLMPTAKKPSSSLAALNPAFQRPEPTQQDKSDPLKVLLALAGEKGVKTRVVKAIQFDLGVKATGSLTRAQAKMVTPEMITKYTDGVAKVKTKEEKNG